MHRFFLFAVCALLLAPVASWAANPHFTRCTESVVNGIVIVSGQVAGLGNQMRPPTPLHLEATATAQCVDLTTTPPTVSGTTTVSGNVTFPPKNGNRVYTFALAPPVDLVCTAPSQVVFSNVEVCDLTHPEAGCCPVPMEPEPVEE